MHATLSERRVALAPSRKMTAVGAPGAQYILDSDIRTRHALTPTFGLPQLTTVKLITFADDVEARLTGEKPRGVGQAGHAHRRADAGRVVGAIPDIKLGTGGSGGGARALRFRKAVYGSPLGAGATARGRASEGPPGFRASRGPTTIIFPGGDNESIRDAPIQGYRRARPASAMRGMHKPRVSRGVPSRFVSNRDAKPKNAEPKPNLSAAERQKPKPNPVDHFPVFHETDCTRRESGEVFWPEPLTPEEPAERVPKNIAKSGVARTGMTQSRYRARRGFAGDGPVPAKTSNATGLEHLGAYRALLEASNATRAASRAAKRDRESLEALDAALKRAIAIGLPHSECKRFRDAFVEAASCARAARARETVRASLTAAVTRNQPSVRALDDAKTAGLGEDDPAVLAMRACVNRARREARDVETFEETRDAMETDDDEGVSRDADAFLFDRESIFEVDDLETARGAPRDGGFSETERFAEPSPSSERSERDVGVVGRGSLLGGGALRVEELVGEGAYGRVMRCVDVETGTTCAVKEFKINENDPDVEEVRRTSEREVSALRALTHPNIIKHLGDFYQNDKLYVAMEFVPRTLLQILQSAERPLSETAGDDVEDETGCSGVKKNQKQDENEKSTAGGLPANDVRRYVYQLCLALTYLHESGYVYRDVKPENLLVGDDGVLKLCDFGFARELPGNVSSLQTDGDEPPLPLTDYVATRWYRAPELLLGQPYRTADGSSGMRRVGYGQPVDMWAVGCLTGELSDGEPMFPGENDVDQLRLVQRCLGRLTPGQMMAFSVNPHNAGVTFPDDELGVPEEKLSARYAGVLDAEALDFVSGLLELNPKRRRSGKACLEHPYFRGSGSE
jgi:cyclin-dependent kinase-like